MNRNPVEWVCRRCFVKLLKTHDLLDDERTSYGTIFRCDRCQEAIKQEWGMPVLVPVQRKDVLDQLAAIE